MATVFDLHDDVLGEIVAMLSDHDRFMGLGLASRRLAAFVYSAPLRALVFSERFPGFCEHLQQVSEMVLSHAQYEFEVMDEVKEMVTAYFARPPLCRLNLRSVKALSFHPIDDQFSFALLFYFADYFPNVEELVHSDIVRSVGLQMVEFPHRLRRSTNGEAEYYGAFLKMKNLRKLKIKMWPVSIKMNWDSLESLDLILRVSPVHGDLDFLSNAINLKFLQIDADGEGMIPIPNLEKLERLSVRHPPSLSGEEWDAFMGKSLKSLSFHYFGKPGSKFINVSKFGETLEELHIDFVQAGIEEDGLDDMKRKLSHLPKLKSLKLNSHGGHLFPYFELSKLSRLDINCDTITTSLINQFCEMLEGSKNLTELRMNNATLTATVIALVGSLSNLTSFEIDETEAGSPIGPSNLISLLQVLSDKPLTKLSLRPRSLYFSETFANMIVQCAHLTSLVVASGSLPFDNNAFGVLGNHPSLTSIAIIRRQTSGQPSQLILPRDHILSEKSLREFLSKCRSLRSLHLSHIIRKRVGDVRNDLLKEYPWLQRVNLKLLPQEMVPSPPPPSRKGGGRLRELHELRCGSRLMMSLSRL